MCLPSKIGCEDVYEWIKAGHNSDDEIDSLHTCFYDWEEDDKDFKPTIISNNGETGSDYESWDDLYYGQTHIDWVLKYENIDLDSTIKMKEFGIRIFVSERILNVKEG